MIDATAAEPSSAAPGNGRLVAIEALRGGAALAVVIVHSLGAAAGAGAPWPAALALPWLAGVDVFFVVSGFVMVHASARWFGASGGRRRFVAHRIARVIPLYWLVTTAFAAAALLRPTAFTDPLGGWQTVLASYLLVPWPRGDGSMLPVFRLGWTLEYEALFYAVFAAWMGLARHAALLGMGLSLAGLVALGLAWPAAPPPIRFWSDPILLEFGFGMALATARGAGLRLPVLAAPALALGGLGLLMHAGSLIDAPLRPVAYGLPASLLVALALLTERPVLPGWARGVALRAGAISYSLYLTHLFAVRALREATAALPVSAPLFVAFAVACSLVLATVVHRLVERPAISALRRWLG